MVVPVGLTLLNPGLGWDLCPRRGNLCECKGRPSQGGEGGIQECDQKGHCCLFRGATVDSAGPSAGTTPRQPCRSSCPGPTITASLPMAATCNLSVFWPVAPSGQGVLVGRREWKLWARNSGLGELQLGLKTGSLALSSIWPLCSAAAGGGTEAGLCLRGVPVDALP